MRSYLLVYGTSLAAILSNPAALTWLCPGAGVCGQLPWMRAGRPALPGQLPRASHGSRKDPGQDFEAGFSGERSLPLVEDTNSPAPRMSAPATCRISRLRTPMVAVFSADSASARLNTSSRLCAGS